MGQFISKCDSALKDEYYLEVITTATAIIDDRIQSICNKIFSAPIRVIRDPHDSTINLKFLEYSSVNIDKILKKYLDTNLQKTDISKYEIRIIGKMNSKSQKYISFFSKNTQFCSPTTGYIISNTDLTNDSLLYPYLSHFINNLFGNLQLNVSNQTMNLSIELMGLYLLIYYKEIFIPIRNKLIHNLTDWRFQNDLNNYNDLKVTAHLFNELMRDFLALGR